MTKPDGLFFEMDWSQGVKIGSYRGCFLLQIGKVLYDKLTEGACCLREIMLLMPGYSKGPLTAGIRQVKRCEGLLVDLFLHQRRRESYTEMGFDEFKEDRWLIY